MNRPFDKPRKSERAGSEESGVARLATDPWLLWPAQDLGSEARRHFSGLRRFDFPVQYGPFPLQTAVGSARATHIRLEIPAQGGT
jgi:hypothetical protein